MKDNTSPTTSSSPGQPTVGLVVPATGPAEPVPPAKQPANLLAEVIALKLQLAESQQLVEKYQAHIQGLAGGLVWALKFLRNNGLWSNIKTGESMPWEERFMDLLEVVGIEVDRKQYWKNREKKTGRKPPAKKAGKKKAKP